MNESFIINNTFSEILEQFFIQIGSTWQLDAVYMYLVTLLGLIGFVLNAFALFVFFKINTDQPVYKYYKIYTFNEMIISLILAFSFYARSPRYFDNLPTFGTSIFKCNIQLFAFSLEFFLSLIDICIQFERISLFKPWLEKYFKSKPYLVSFICFVFSVLFLIPLYLSTIPRDESEYRNLLINFNNSRSIVYCKRTSFTATLHGRILIILSTLIRDIVFSIIELISTLISLYYLKKFFNKKEEILKKSVRNTSKSISKISNKKGSALHNESQIHNQNKHQVVQNITPNQTSSSNKSKRNITIMSLALASVSILCKITSLSYSVSFLFNSQFSHHYITLSNILAAPLKAIASFIILLIFNKNFRCYISNIFQKNA